MQIIQPRPFTFEAGNRAVLLLHAFTGHSADVRMLGRFLQDKKYTTHAPIYSGHGVAPEELVKTNPEQWWEDVLQGYEHLRKLGYEEIAVAGLSLGGVFSLKLAYSKDVKAVISMATPMYFDNREKLRRAFEVFAKQYKQFEGKDREVIRKEMNELMKDAPIAIDHLHPLIQEVSESLNKIDVPMFVVQPAKDQLINMDSASFIYDHIQSEQKELKWYEQSTHVITMDQERDELHEDIYKFLESLHWNKS